VAQSRLAEDWYRITCPVEAAAPRGIVGASFRLVPRPASLAPAGRMTGPAMAAELDRYLPKLVEAGLFTGVVLFAKDGQPLFEKAYGRGDHGPFTPDSRFGLASINKSFTAVAVAQLAQQGKLSFQDPISKYLPEYPRPQGDQITIHHLLTHTSGTASFLGDRDFEEARQAGVRTLEQMAAFIGRKPLVSPPGTKFLYSNGGYFLLQAIIERMANRSFEEYVRQQVFAPAGMTQTGDGMSTAGDLMRFATALQNGKLLSPAMARTLMEPKVDSDDPNAKYAYGLEVEMVNGTRIAGHAGGGPNISAQLDMYPDGGYTVVVLSSRRGNTAQRVATRLREMLTVSGQ